MILSRKHHKIVFSFVMSLLMSCAMSLAICIFNFGLVAHIVEIWLKAWIFAFSVAFPTIVLISPFVHKLVNMVLVGEISPPNAR